LAQQFLLLVLLLVFLPALIPALPFHRKVPFFLTKQHPLWAAAGGPFLGLELLLAPSSWFHHRY
jgi:hypothetical protein